MSSAFVLIPPSQAQRRIFFSPWYQLKVQVLCSIPKPPQWCGKKKKHEELESGIGGKTVMVELVI